MNQLPDAVRQQEWYKRFYKVTKKDFGKEGLRAYVEDEEGVISQGYNVETQCQLNYCLDIVLNLHINEYLPIDQQFITTEEKTLFRDTPSSIRDLLRLGASTDLVVVQQKSFDMMTPLESCVSCAFWEGYLLLFIEGNARPRHNKFGGTLISKTGQQWVGHSWDMYKAESYKYYRIPPPEAGSLAYFGPCRPISGSRGLACILEHAQLDFGTAMPSDKYEADRCKMAACLLLTLVIRDGFKNRHLTPKWFKFIRDAMLTLQPDFCWSNSFVQPLMEYAMTLVQVRKKMNPDINVGEEIGDFLLPIYVKKLITTFLQDLCDRYVDRWNRYGEENSGNDLDHTL